MAGVSPINRSSDLAPPSLPAAAAPSPAAFAAAAGTQTTARSGALVPAAPGATTPTEVSQQLIPLIQQLISALQQVLGQKPAAATPAAMPPAAPSTLGTPSMSAGSGPNQVQITNTQDRAMSVGMFLNGQSTTAPAALITLQPGQTGVLSYQNGQAGFMAQADGSGRFQPNASRLEFEADANGHMKYPDVSYIDGRNASISLTDNAGLNKGDSTSIAGSAPAGIVTTDAAGNKTIAGWYDGSTGQMQQGGAFLQAHLGTGGAYIHPNDDTLPPGQNPMSGTQATTLRASFGNA